MILPELRRGRFVILEHDHPTLHWDFMLEADGTLKTWRLPAPPTSGDFPAERIGDHRLAYLDYTGPVSGGRGQVTRWDAGAYETIDANRIRLVGERGVSVVAIEVSDSGCLFRVSRLQESTAPGYRDCDT